MDWLLLDSSFHLLAQVDGPYLGPTNLFISDKSNVLGQPFYKDSVFYTYFTYTSPGMAEGLYVKYIDFGKQTTGERLPMLVRGYQEVMGSFLDSYHRPIMMVDSLNTHRFSLYTPLDSNPYSDQDLPYNRQDLHLASNNDPGIHYGFIHYIDENQPQQFDDMAARTLAYVRGNQLVLFCAQPDSALELTVVDLTTLNAHIKQEPSPTPSDKTEHFSVCSAVCGDKIFRLDAFKDHLDLAVYHIPDLSLLKHYQWSATQPPVFALNPSSYNYTAHDKEESPHYPFIKLIGDLYEGRLGMAVNITDSGAYQITIGSYYDYTKLYDSKGRAKFAGINSNATVKAAPEFDIAQTAQNVTQNVVQDNETAVNASPAVAVGFGLAGGAAMEISASVQNNHFAFKDPTGRYKFRASLAKVALDGQSLENIPAANYPLGDSQLTDHLPEQKGKTAVRTFVRNNRIYVAYYDLKTSSYLIQAVSR